MDKCDYCLEETSLTDGVCNRCGQLLERAIKTSPRPRLILAVVFIIGIISIIRFISVTYLALSASINPIITVIHLTLSMLGLVGVVGLLMRKEWSLKCITIASIYYMHSATVILREAQTADKALFATATIALIFFAFTYTLFPTARSYVGLSPLGQKN